MLAPATMGIRPLSRLGRYLLLLVLAIPSPADSLSLLVTAGDAIFSAGHHLSLPTPGHATGTSYGKILGAFRTTPTTALQTEAALPPAHIRFRHTQRKYAIQILIMPKSHPIRRRCPISLSPNHWYDLDLAPEDRRCRNWSDTSPSDKPFSTQLIRIHSYFKGWIGHGSDVGQEEYPTWAETLLQTR